MFTNQLNLVSRDVEFIAEYSGLPVYIKGPQCREDVGRSLAAGLLVSGGSQPRWSSNRQWTSCLYFASKWQKRLIDVCRLSLTPGVSSWSARLQSLGFGADLVAIGHPVIYGLALSGSVGVRKSFEHLNAELKTVYAIYLELRPLKMSNTSAQSQSIQPNLPVDPRDLKLYW